MMLEKFTLHPGIEIRKGSVVALRLKQFKRPVVVEVIRIFCKDNEVFVEAIKCGSKTTGVHSIRVYRDFGIVEKF